MSISIVIPCKDEEHNICPLVENIVKKLESQNFSYEIILIDDFSLDKTYDVIHSTFINNNKIQIEKNINKGGLGEAIKLGILKSKLENICFMMADGSDSIDDLISYIKIIQTNEVDAVLGSRFINGSSVNNYPFKKLILNRIFNKLTQILFMNEYNDFTNAFKIYKKKTLLKLYPIVSENFNIFLELPLKLISRGYNYKIIPISWHNRKYGVAKFRIKELGSKYFFTLLYCLLEKILLKKNKKNTL